MATLPNYRYNRSLRARCENNSIHVKTLVERDYQMPEWQRTAVWTDKNRHKLIGALINGRPFPEIFIWRDTSDSTILDESDVISYVNEGQQRVRAITGFITGKYAVPSSYLEPVLRFDKPCNVHFTDLSEEIRRDILYTKLSIVEMANMSQAEAILHFIDGGENVKPLSRPELINALISSHAHRLCYKEFPKTDALECTSIPRNRFKHEEQYSFLLQMVTTRFRIASPAKHLKELFHKYSAEHFTEEEFNALEQVVRTRKLIGEIKAIAEQMPNSRMIRTEELHLLATFLYDVDPINTQLESIANWYGEFLGDLSNAITSNDPTWTPWFAQAAKTFYSIPALNCRLSIMKTHYQKWCVKSSQKP